MHKAARLAFDLCKNTKDSHNSSSKAKEFMHRSSKSSSEFPTKTDETMQQSHLIAAL